MRGSPHPPTPPGLAELPEAVRARALHRWRVLRPHLEDGVPLPRAAGEAEVALRTAQRWLTLYRADGLAGLARTPRADRGTRRLPEDLRLLIEGLARVRPRSCSTATCGSPSNCPVSTTATTTSTTTRPSAGGRPWRYPDELGWLREALALNAEEPHDDEDLEPLL